MERRESKKLLSYTEFEELCGPQLAGSGVPLELWGIVFDKLRHEVFDAGSAFQLASVQAESDDDSASEVMEGDGDVCDDSRADIASTTDQASPLVLASVRSLNATEDIWLLDHAWTFRIRQARNQLVQNELLRQRMGTMLLGDPHASVDAVYESLWAKASTYRVATDASLDEECCWYVMDEVGTAISLVASEEESNCRFVPLFSPTNNMAVSVLWITKPVEAGEMIKFCPMRERNSSPGIALFAHYLATAEGDREALEAQFLGAYALYHDTVTSQWNTAQHKLVRAEAPSGVVGARRVRVLSPTGGPYRVACDSEELVRNVRANDGDGEHQKYTFTPELHEADILWLTEFQAGGLPATSYPTALFVSQMGVESVLCHKGRLQRALRVMFGDPEWLPRTYDAASEMHLFVGDYLSRKASGENNLWISKPHCMARSMDMVVTDCLPLLLRQSETGPKLLCKYIDRPCLFHGRKFDLRVIVGVQQLLPTRRVFVYDRVWPRFALEPYDLNDLDMYEKHWTVMNYANEEKMINLLHADFIVAFDEQHGAGQWDVAMQRIRAMIAHVFDAVVADPSVTVAEYGVGLFGFDVILREDLWPMLLEATFAPDCHRACVQYPTFFADVFSTLLWNKPHNFTLLTDAADVEEIHVSRAA